MAHFAELDKNNVVIRVVVVANEDIKTLSGKESERIGLDFLEKLYGHRRWKQTSYNSFGGIHSRGKSNMRKNFASIGSEFKSHTNSFIFKKPFPSWRLEALSGLWGPPISMPKDNNLYKWKEDTLKWEKVNAR